MIDNTKTAGFLVNYFFGITAMGMKDRSDSFPLMSSMIIMITTQGSNASLMKMLLFYDLKEIITRFYF